jgi:O-antigen/teichoic acid export membrane protein
MTRLIFWLGLPVAAVMFVAAPWVMRIFGPEFPEGASAFRVLLAGQFLAAATGLAGASLYMTGHHKAAAANMVCFAGLNVLLNGLLIPHFGMMGAAAATATAIIGMKLTNVILAYRRLGIVSFPLDLRWLLKRLPF